MLLTIFTLSNIGIAAGYIYAATAVAPKIGAKRWQTKLGAVLFLAMCGFTHLEQAVHAVSGSAHSVSDLTSWHMVLIHFVQFIGIWMFLLSLYRELVEGTVKSLFNSHETEGEGDE